MNAGLVADENTGSVLFYKDDLNHLDYNVIKDLKVGRSLNLLNPETMREEMREGKDSCLQNN